MTLEIAPKSLIHSIKNRRDLIYLGHVNEDIISRDFPFIKNFLIKWSIEWDLWFTIQLSYMYIF